MLRYLTSQSLLLNASLLREISEAIAAIIMFPAFHYSESVRDPV
jgi:hypothetical protein